MSENAFLNQTVEKINDKLDRNIYENLWTFSVKQTEMPGVASGIKQKKNIFEKKFRIFKEKKIVFFAYVTPGVLKGSVKKFNAFGPAAGRLASNS